MYDPLPFLKKILALPGLSGYEDPVRLAIAEEWGPFVDELKISRLGSLYGIRRGNSVEPRPRILLAAHMDAIGLMTTMVDHGLIHFTEVGGVDPRILPGQQVIVHGRRDLPGVIGQPAARLLPDSIGKKAVPMEYLLIDVGLSAEETAGLVRPGDLISFAQPPIELTDNSLAGHTLDNRASVAALSVCLSELSSMRHAWDVWAVATVQEEETLAGAFTSPVDIEPDIAVAIDVTFAKGPGASDYRTVPFGKGICLGWGPNTHPAIFEAFKKVAEHLDIPFQTEVSPSQSGTDAMGLQVAAGGLPSLYISIPIRYMHTPVEMVCMKDIQRAGHLLAQAAASLQPDFVQQIRWED
ncbi:MAG: M42 family metallopeptidase [Leptolinea sp.]|jgi:endoglucanase|nr:M42 family metallopeptidase [Leptolinea sp.]